MAEKFNDVPSLTIDHDTIAEIERNKNVHQRYHGLVWIDSCWLDVEQARALRDWLNQALPS